MAFLKRASGVVVHRGWSPENWGNFVGQNKERLANGPYRTAAGALNLVAQASEILGEEFDPKNFLLTHATIVASVDTEEAGNVKLGSVVEDGRKILRKFGDYRITPDTEQWINNNHDSWSRGVLLKSYRTFVGAHNFLEHCQLEHLSKGRIVDAVARDIGPSIYVDILVATNRKHASLIQDIENGRMGTLSMGCTCVHTTCTKCGNVGHDETELCFPPGTRVLLAEGKYRPIEEIVEGDFVLSHTGRRRAVVRTMRREYEGNLVVLDVEGVPVSVKATPKHPFWTLRPAQICACGCGQPLRRTVEHERGSAKAFKRRFLPHHAGSLHNVVSMDAYQRIFDTEMEFVEAQDLRRGDYLAFPIPRDVENSADATVNRARLIGFFLAEGSFIKRDGRRVGIAFSFGYHEYDTLAAEVQRLLNLEFGRDERRQDCLDWQDLVARNHTRAIKRRANSRAVPPEVTCPTCAAPSQYAYNARFKAGHDDCYQCKVCGRSWIHQADRSLHATRYKCPIDRPETGSVEVRLMDEEAADFFYSYCGEYANEKALDPSVLRWAPDVQRHVLFGWLGGDGTQSVVGIRGNTASFHLQNQMHILAARCGLYAYRTVVFDGRSGTIDQVVNGDGSVTARDCRGWLPSFGLVLSEPKGFNGEVRFSDREPRTTLTEMTDSYKRVGDWFVYRIRDVGRESYCGTVHNLEISEDNSYVVDGLAVHNCNHVRYEKGNAFYDQNGVRRKVAELCGHASEDPTGGVNFIEASWVAVPAFAGAVMRNILQPEAVNVATNEQVRKVLASPPPEWTDTDDHIQKAASTEVAKVVTPARQPRTQVHVAQFGPSEDESSDDAATESTDSLTALEDEIEKYLLDKVKKRIKDKLKADVQEEAASEGELATSTGDSVVHQAALRMAFGTDTLLRIAGSDVELVDGLARLAASLGIKVSRDLYRTALRVGPARSQESLDGYLSRCGEVLGRHPTTGEAKTLVRLGRILSMRARRSSARGGD